MWRLVMLVGSLGVLMPAAAAAQEPRTPARGRVYIDGDEIRPWDLLARRRARIGVTVDIRAVENDSIGATIQSVTPGGPAAKAGLQSGDVITRFNGRALVRAERDDRSADRGDDEESSAAIRLIEMVAKLDPGDTVDVEYRRGSDTRTTRVVTSKEFLGDGFMTFDLPRDGERMIRRLPRIEAREGPNGFVMAFGGRFADLELAPLNAELGTYFGTSDGVLVISAPEKNSLGLKGGDVILSIDGRRAKGPASLLRILRTYEEGDVVKLEIMRNKSRTTISSKITRDDDEED